MAIPALLAQLGHRNWGEGWKGRLINERELMKGAKTISSHMLEMSLLVTEE